MINEDVVATSKAIQFISFPIPDRGIPSSTRDALQLLTNITAALEKGEKAAVHCRQRIGRSGLIAAGLLVLSGMGAEKAIDVVSAARGTTVPETPSQVEWIKHLPSEHLVSA